MTEIPMYFPLVKDGFEILVDNERRQDYIDFTLDAANARALPDQSGYFVKTNLRAKNGKKWKGGNKEHALSDALVHGETATISALRDITDSPLEVLAWYADIKDNRIIKPHDFGCPCGACLDVLVHFCAANFVMLNGNETGVVYTQLRDFLFDKFMPGDQRRLNNNEVKQALAAADRGNDVYLPDRLKAKMYGAVLVGKGGNIWKGIHYTNAGFDAIPPVMNAVLHWQNDYPNGKVSEKHLGLQKLVVASRGDAPVPLYRDRQAILELDEILRRYRGDNVPLPVELVQVNGKEVTVKQTNVDEWLPHPFSPGAFRMDDVILAELIKYVGADEARKAFT